MGRAGLRQIGAALLTVALCYAPLVYVKLAGKLQSFEEPCGCRCSGAPSRAVWASSGGSRHGTVTENKPARSSSHLLAPERVAFSRFAASESSPVEAIRRGGEHLEAPSGQMSAEEAWEAYVQAAKEAAESPECRFQASKSLLAKIQQGGGQRQAAASPSPPRGLERPRECVAMDSACAADAKCHENDSALVLAKSSCSNKKHMAACKFHDGSHHMPHHCVQCRDALKLDRKICNHTGKKCDEAQEACALALRSQTGIDSTLEWLSFWDEGHYDPRDFAGWANFGFSKDVAQICRGAAMGQRHMLKVGGCFFAHSPLPNSKHKKRLKVVEDWEHRWETFKAVPEKLMESGAIFGVFLGDELLWSGVALDDIEMVASRVRADLPGVTIWMNEARGPVMSGATQFQSQRFQMPESVSWISVDHYHFTPDPDYVKELKAHWKRNRSLDLLLPTQRELRRLHRLHIYPLLQENQSVVLVPGAFASNKNSACDLECYESFMSSDADEIIKWAWEDEKIIGIVPYHWNFCPHCGATRNEIGVKDMNSTKSKWLSIGERVVANQDNLLMSGWCSLPGITGCLKTTSAGNQAPSRCYSSGCSAGHTPSVL